VDLLSSLSCRLALLHKGQLVEYSKVVRMTAVRKTMYLINDTGSSNHAGCKAVMRSLLSSIKEIGSIDLIGTCKHTELSVDEATYRNSDIIFVNGEGTIHHSNRHALHLLHLIGRAKRDGKKVVLANALFQQYEYSDDSILEGLSLLAVREPRSSAFARSFRGDPRMFVDVAADPRFLDEGTPIPGKSGFLIGGFHEKGLLYDPFADIPGRRLSLRNTSFEDVVATLREADIYLTAQHHGVYAAALAGCPFVASPSNSHKIESFLDWCRMPVPVCMSLREVEPATRFALRNRGMYSELAEVIRTLPQLTSRVIREHV